MLLLDLVNDIIDMSYLEATASSRSARRFECAQPARALDPPGRQAPDGFGIKIVQRIAPGAGRLLRSDERLVDGLCSISLERGQVHRPTPARFCSAPRHGAEGGIVIEVADNGIGIAERRCSNVFGAFSQVRAALDRSHEGTGLGLHLAHRIMTLLDGRLEIESQLGAGTTVRLILPDAALETSEAA